MPGQQPIAPAVQLLEMLYLFNSDETLIAVLPRDSFLSPKHHEVLNGANTFTFSYPADQADAQYIVEGSLVGFKDLDISWHIFEIKRVVDLHGDGLARTAYCEHIFYELIDDLVTDIRPSGSAISALSSALTGTRWQVGIVDDLGSTNTNFYYESALSAVQKVATAWAGELQWRCFMSGGVITRYVDLRAMRGTDTGKQFAYSKDILEIEREADSTGVVTALYGRGKGVETASGEGYGRRLTFADVVWVTPTNPANKPAGQEWVGDPGALVQFGRPGGRHRYGVYTNEAQTDAAILLQETWDDLQARKTPRVTYRMKVVTLETLTGYSHEAVRLGDLVRGIDREFKPELLVSARVVELMRDLQDPANTEVVLGSFAPTIIDTTINTERKVNELANKPYNTNWLDGPISILQNEIKNTQSYVFQTPGDGILLMDAATFALATKAMKLGGGIFALANSKTGGAWNWRTFGTGAGFTADEITTGLLSAGLIQIGAASTFAAGYDPSSKLNTPGYVTADAEGIKVFDNLSALRVLVGSWLVDTVRKYGIKIINGEIYSSMFRTTSPTGTNTYIELSTDGQLKVIGPGGSQALNISAGGNMGKVELYSSGTVHGSLSAGQNAIFLSSNASQGISISAYTGEYINLGPVNNSADRGIRISGGIVGDFLPYTDSYSYLGDATHKWLRVNAVNVTASGDISNAGNAYLHNLSTTGSKQAVQATKHYGIRGLDARESPETRYIDEGAGELNQGECRIDIDPIFLECIEPNLPISPWFVHLTPYADVSVYVAEIGTDYFIARERSGGTSNNKFFWSLSTIRGGWAGRRLEELGYTESKQVQELLDTIESLKSQDDVLTSNWEDELL